MCTHGPGHPHGSRPHPDPRPKLATARSLSGEALTHTLGEEFAVGDSGENELYRAMDWRVKRRGRIAEEAGLDGICVIGTNVPGRRLPAEEAVRSYESLSRIAWAFRSYKTVDLKARPVPPPSKTGSAIVSLGMSSPT